MLPFDAFQLSHFVWTRHASHGCVAFSPIFPFSAYSIFYFCLCLCILPFAFNFRLHLLGIFLCIFLQFILKQFSFHMMIFILKFFSRFHFALCKYLSTLLLMLLIRIQTDVAVSAFSQLMVRKRNITCGYLCGGHLQVDFVSLSQTNLTLIDAKINLKSNFLLPIYTIGKSFRLRAGGVEEEAGRSSRLGYECKLNKIAKVAREGKKYSSVCSSA